MGWKVHLFYLLSLAMTSSGFVGTSPVEEFEEELIIRPLRDGKVTSHFSFKTLLRGATPRDPATLGHNDECTSR